MPAGFDKCVASNGKIRTISGANKRFGLKAGEYMHVCFDGMGMHRGDVKSKQKDMSKSMPKDMSSPGMK